MFHATSDIDDTGDTRCRYIGHYQSHQQHTSNLNNGVNTEILCTHQSTTKATTKSFIKRLNPFSKSKSHEINTNINSESGDNYKSKTFDSKDFVSSVKVLKQFWSDQIKISKSTDNLNCKKSATIKYLSQSNDSIYEKPSEKSQTLDNRSVCVVDDFNKFKDATFVRNQKSRLIKNSFSCEKEATNFYPSISLAANGGKIHWTKRDEISSSSKNCVATGDLTTTMTTIKQQQPQNSQSKRDSNMSVSRKESISSSAGSITSSTNSTSRKFSFKTSPSIRSNYTKKTSTNGTKVAQIAQKFNQIIQQDSTLLDEVKKRGTIVVHGSGGRVFKIKEDKKSEKTVESPKRTIPVVDDEVDTTSLAGLGGKNSTRRKSTMLKKRPSIRILVESPKKEANVSSNVLTKKQLYEANVVNKETIVFKAKPKVPDKSDRVLAKTLELRNKKNKTDDERTNELAEIKSTAIVDQVQSKTKNNFQKIYDKISFRPTFLYGYGKKAETSGKSPTIAEKSEVEENVIAVNASNKEINDTKTTTTVDDDLELAPIDLKLNVYFKDENLSAATTTSAKEENVDNIDDETNINSQGSIDDDDVINDEAAAKPNSSFLFRSQTSTKSDTTACDVFIRDMLFEQTDENNYEIIAKVSDDIQSRGESENIYQTLSEVKGVATLSDTADDDNDSIKSYESFETYDVIGQNILDNKNNIADLLESHEDDYIVPEKAPEPPPPRKNTIPIISQPILTSTTSTLLLQNEMQVPMIAPNYELKKSSSTTSSTYEKIKYDRLPKLQQQNEKSNIYDTIRSEKCVVSGNDNNNDKCSNIDDNTYENATKNETMSLISNCYETISLRQNNYSTINQILRNAISTTTLTSEHRINSIYGTMVGQSLTPPSDRSASDNSDEWIDLTDEENEPETDNNRFIV